MPAETLQVARRPRIRELPNLQGLWERVYVVNLDRREDRWQAFLNQPHCKPWPFIEPQRFRAIDGAKTERPAWWGAGLGAWGCFRSHLRIIEECLNEDVASVLIMEDDCEFIEGWQQRFSAFLQALPANWQWLYLGGQHWRSTPTRVNEHVLRCENMQRTHAYGLRGKDALQTVYKHITDYPAHAQHQKPKDMHHIDHRFGVLQRTGALRVFAPTQWFCAQAAGKSNIGKETERRVWNPKVENKKVQQKRAAPQPVPARQETTAGGGQKAMLFSAFNNRFPLYELIGNFFRAHGWDFVVRGGSFNWSTAFTLVEEIRKCRLVIIWNGDEPGCDWLRRVCDAHSVRWVIAENGLLPQAGYWHMDPKGLTGGSSLCDDLKWVTPAMIARSQEHIQRHFACNGLKRAAERYVLVPLQLQKDTSIYLHSPFKTMAEFLTHVREHYHGEIVVAKHPHGARVSLPTLPQVTVAKKPTIEMAQQARLVVGLTSTVLYETAALGVPTVALGNCPMKVHGENNLERLLAAVVARQLPREEVDLLPYFLSLGVEI